MKKSQKRRENSLNILKKLPINNNELIEKGKPGESRGRKATSLRRYCYDSRVTKEVY
jgi:hypothetical protein